MQILKTKENISTLALVYLDETDGFLKEVTEENMYVAIPSFKKGLKRFYLIGDYLYNYSISVRALVTNPELIVKVLLGRKINTLDIFTPATHIDKVIYQEAAFKYGNAVPLDILIESQTILELTESLIIEIGTEEFTELSCHNAINSSDCISFEGTCDLYIDSILILTNASESEVRNYFDTSPNFSTSSCELDLSLLLIEQSEDLILQEKGGGILIKNTTSEEENSSLNIEHELGVILHESGSNIGI